MIVRDITIHWERPHLELEWEHLVEAVMELGQKHFHPEDMHLWENGESHHYSLPKNELVTFAHIVLALEQVLQVSHQFLGCSQQGVFQLDHQFQLLWVMAWNESSTEIAVTVAMSQKHATITDKHIKTFLNSL
jgi:hypothetical protein